MREFARILIFVTVLAWIALDIWLYFNGGNPDTISATIVRQAWYHPYIPFLIGVLIGHTIFDMREKIDWNKDETK